MKRFHVDMPYEVEEGVEVSLCISGSMATHYPERRHLENGDPGYPDDGGEFEDLQIRNTRGVRLPQAVEDRLIRDGEFMRRLDEAVECSYKI